MAGAALRASAIHPVTTPARQTQPAMSYQKSLVDVLRSPLLLPGPLCCAPHQENLLSQALCRDHAKQVCCICASKNSKHLFIVWRCMWVRGRTPGVSQERR